MSRTLFLMFLALLWTTVAWAAKIDLNSATAKELTSLPGIGDAYAQRIVEYRQANGPFTDPHQVTDVKGIGEGTYAKIEALISVGGEGEAAPASPAAPESVVSAIQAALPRVDLNSASADELTGLPGIGATYAQRIVEYRQANGPFTDPHQVTDVKGIGEGTYTKIAALVTVDGSAPAATAPVPTTSSSSSSGPLVNINSASASELTSLPGIGDTYAQRIVEYREANGPFTDGHQLTAVKGIGEGTYAKIAALISVDGSSAAATPTAGSEPEPQPAAAPAGPTVNINTASAAELETLPQIGPVKAARIVQDREANGSYASCDDLQRVSGIGPATVSQVEPYCTVE